MPPYFVDFACIEAKLIVEADGNQHATPGDHDCRDAFLRSKGRRILRFWNNDILQNTNGVFRVIIETLENNLSTTPGQPPPRPSPVATREGEPRSGWEGAGTNPSSFGHEECHPPARECSS